MLKSIEIFGFKSFAEKCVIAFDKPITCIVGPNGSGKSNLVDAVRWAIGEQRTKQLRSAKMEDVIFSGSKEKKPLGYAQVSIFFDNSDKSLPIAFEEVKVTRRMYRSGESEFLINGIEARLKDVSELFYDTGLAREGYSIIGQGKIEEIVTSSPQERKLLIEEAVGIVRYKLRKSEAERKLERTQENLFRITDIIAELDGRMPALKRQSDKAKRYFTLREELKELEIGAFVLRIDELTNSINRLMFEKASFEESLSALESEKESLTNRMRTLKEEIDKSADSMAEYEARHMELHTMYEQARTEALLSAQNAESSQNIVRKAIEELSELQISLAYSKEREQEILIESSEALKEQKIAETENDNALSAASEAEKRLIAVRWEKKAISEGQENLSNLMFIANRLAEEASSINESISKIPRQNLPSIDALESKRIAYNTARNRSLQISNEIDSYRLSISQKTEALQSLKHKFSNISFQNTNSQPIQKALEYSSNKKELKSKIFGTLGQLITPDDKYALAISIALGAAGNYIVCSDSITASLIIAEMKKNEWGRVTFLPIDIVKGEKERFRISHAGFIANAADLVKYDRDIANCVYYALGKIIIVDCIQSALEIAKFLNYSRRIVTLEGETVSIGGALTGGIQKFSDPLLQKTEMLSLKSQIDEAEKKLAEIVDLRDKAEAILPNLKEEADSKQVEFENANLIFASEEASAIASNKEIERLKNLLASVLEKHENVLSKIALQEEALSLSSKQGTEISDDDFFELAEAKEAKAIKLIKANEKTNRIQERLDRERETIEQLTKRITKAESDISYGNDNLEQSKISALKALKLEKELEEAKAEFEKEREDDAKRRQKNSNEYISSSEQIIVLTDEIAKVSEKAYRIDVQVEGYKTESRSLKLQMLEDYSISYALSLKQSSVLDLADAKERIMQTKDAISKLGSINADAPEEYLTVKERFDSLLTQKEDVIKAKQELESIISDITRNLANQFNEMFAKIQQGFCEAFELLFQGGEARLILTNPDDLQSSGVDIQARPPNTRLKSISSLSGGEKALCAIALIISILRLKPSPFCMLDEIDAALDEGNVARFAKFLRESSDDNQFIVVTHKRRTMMLADSLYGASMDESGTTRFVSLSLDEIEKGAYAYDAKAQ